MTTPMLRQYERIKKEYEDAVLLFRVGDFYECYKRDAEILAECCKITLTSKDYGESRVPMSGVPHHSVYKYIRMLLRDGYKIAICEQVEEASKKVGQVVRREVTNVITPGTVTDLTMLEDEENNYLVGVVRMKGGYGVSFVDVSTGEFFGTEVRGVDEVDGVSKLISELVKFRPAECIMPESLYKDEGFVEKIREYTEVTIYKRDDREFEIENAREAMKEQFGVLNLSGFGCENKPGVVMSAGGIIKYLEEIKMGKESNIKGFSVYNRGDYMIIDAASQRNLELVRNIMEDTTRGTLLSILDKTVTPMGGRKLRKWIKQPLIDIEKIKERQEMVGKFKDDLFLRQDVRGCLKGIYDMERLMGKISHGSANARDLVALRSSLEKVPEIDEILKKRGGKLGEYFKDELIRGVMDVAELIKEGIRDDPGALIKEGGIIKKGFNSKLDELLKIIEEGKDYLINLENKERMKTGIKSLKIKYNKVFGYFIEVTKANLNLVPKERYIRKQTLANAERYFTEDLKRWEEEILGAEEKVSEMEYEIFMEIIKEVNKYIEEVQEVSNLIGEIDIYAGLAEVAALNSYIRPEITGTRKIWIKEGRHPVLDIMLVGEFIPNDIILDGDEYQLLIITGPNMAGKSTYLRQVAQIVILAQMGAFIPAEEAEIGVVDQIFVRVGAYDNIVLQQSTFLVEMNETANILNNATERSLILLDEVGRGTATFDGLSIAWAVVEYIVEEIGARTLFATHYHQLNELSKYFKGIKNYNIVVKRSGEKIIFLYKVEPGGSDKSYGVEVARLAGVPEKVVKRANEILKALEEGNEIKVSGESKRSGKVGESNKVEEGKKRKKRVVQLTFTASTFKDVKEKDENEEEVIKEIKGLKLEELTPLEALNKLNELRKRLKGDKNGNK